MDTTVTPRSTRSDRSRRRASILLGSTAILVLLAALAYAVPCARVAHRLTTPERDAIGASPADLGLAFERVDAGGQFGVVDTPEYARLNPNRRVPVIEDDGFVLWESNAIVRYLCAKHPERGLYPQSLQARADAERWMDWCSIELIASMRDAFWQLVRTEPAKRQQSVIDASSRQTESLLGILESALAGRDYIGGDRFGMADIPLACAAHRWRLLPVERAARPNVDRWLERAAQRPGARDIARLRPARRSSKSGMCVLRPRAAVFCEYPATSWSFQRSTEKSKGSEGSSSISSRSVPAIINLPNISSPPRQ